MSGDVGAIAVEHQSREQFFPNSYQFTIHGSLSMVTYS
jgi:hypothetical protein